MKGEILLVKVLVYHADDSFLLNCRNPGFCLGDRLANKTEENHPDFLSLFLERKRASYGWDRSTDTEGSVFIPWGPDLGRN